MSAEVDRILFVVNNAAFFASHRLPLALAAREQGYEVVLVTGKAGSPTMEASAIELLDRLGIRHVRVGFGSNSVNPVTEAIGVWQLVREMRHWKPTIVHCASPKGLLYGGLAARAASVPGLVLAISGMGFLFTGEGAWVRRMLGTVYSWLAKYAYGHANKRVIVQNRDDEGLVAGAKLARAGEIVLIPGSGVPLANYMALPLESRSDLVVLPARMLRDKGVFEFVEAARLLRKRGTSWRFALVGTADYANPTAISQAQLREWEAEGVVEWWGHCEDMLQVYGQARIVCLPSYREGMPKALLEAAAAGCAVVTTDAVGCREAVIPGETGDLVPVGDVESLASVLRELMEDADRCIQYGLAGRRLAADRFDLESVVRTTLGIYRDLSFQERKLK